MKPLYGSQYPIDMVPRATHTIKRDDQRKHASYHRIQSR